LEHACSAWPAWRRHPAGSSLPFAPYYFPDIVRNADGSLTGYFDYRPKDADEAITVARSTDNGKTWTSEGKALDQNQGYCPTADTNDDGQGHPYVASIGGSTKLYTLNRPAGDYEGVGLLVHNVAPSAPNPLAALPASESVGIDPNTYAEAEVEVLTSGGVSIPVSTLGSENSPEHIVAGPYEDYNASAPSKSVITCKGTNAAPAELTGCTVAGGSALTVKANDDLVQVIGTANPEEVGGKKPAPGATYTVPAGPNNTKGEGGLGKLSFLNGNSTVSPLTTFILNENAPNRVYIDGDTVYCSQSNANPTTKIEDCTNTSGSALTVHQGDAITADPIVPPSAAVTTGLQAPDGIVGTLPSYPGAPAGTTVVLYTEKLLAYFVVGTTNGSVNSKSEFKAGTVTLPASSINYTPSVHPSEPLPSTGSLEIDLGTAKAGIQQVTCTGVVAAPAGAPAGSEDLSGCSGGTGEVEEGFWVGGPNAAAVPAGTLEKIGEGKSTGKGPEKLFANNEDYSVLRAAYTTNGVNFTDLGPISGTASETGNDTGKYDDLSNPFQTTSPSETSPTDLASGEPDTTELRFIGSRGTIITNPDGSYGMFLSGSWATDGDSDAFNQIFYTESTNGKEWSVPKVVLSTDYTFSASAAQDKALGEGKDEPLGISAYYSGRAYGPAVVQNPDGSLTMVFSGYRIPKPITAAGTKLGTNPLAPYTVGAKDPALYRNILTMHLTSATSPGVATTTSVGSSDVGTGATGAAVTYTATVSVNTPGTGTPTGTVSFSDDGTPIAGCTSEPLNEGSPDTATCPTQHPSTAGSDEITATYSGDSNYGESTSSALTETTPKDTTSTAVSASDGGSGVAEAPVTYTAAVSVISPGTGTPTGTVSFSDNSVPIVGCTSEPLNEGSPDTATCPTQHLSSPGSEEITATYTGDPNYAESTSPAFTETTTAKPPTVTELSPDDGPETGKTPVTITGTNLTGATAVDFGMSPATSFEVTSPSTIEAVAPAGTGTVEVTVTTPGGTSLTSFADEFSYLPPPVPTVTRVSPSSGTIAGGTDIKITGTGFVAGAKVEIGQGNGAGPTAIPASEVVVVSPTEITAATGGSAKAGSWNLFVVDAGGTSVANTGDDYTYKVPAPTVSLVSPASGTANGGTHIRIIGTNFVAGATVEIGQGGGAGPTAIQASEVVVVSSTEITATTRGLAKAGTWNLFVIDAGGTSPANNAGDDYTYK
jgi:hypothetical protein